MTGCSNPASCALGVAWLVIFVPLAVYSTWLFWKRREIQPIKARNPNIVVVNDAVLIVFIVTVCFQRIFSKEYPCVLNLWSGWIGLLVIFTSYLWRGWLLYFVYNLAIARLNMKKLQDIPFFVRNRHYASGPFLIRFFGAICVILMMPCAVLTAGPHGQGIISGKGDGPGCPTEWGPLAMALIVGVYILAFMYLSFNLKSVNDNFQIKSELKITGLVACVGVVGWTVFNLDRFESLNDSFPLSTLMLLVSGTTVFVMSTVIPLKRSYLEGEHMDTGPVLDSSSLSSLKDIIAQEAGRANFEQFLVKEFSVENMLFWREVNDFENSLNAVDTTGMDVLNPVHNEEVSEDKFEELLEQARQIYENYIEDDSFKQVNLPADLITRLDDKMREAEEWSEENYPNIVTIYKEAKAEIFKLMNKDSYPRYRRSEVYKEFIAEIDKKKHEQEVLSELNIA